MLRFKKFFSFILILLIFVACSSKDNTIVAPVAVSTLPKTMTVVSYNKKYPTTFDYTWKDGLLVSFTETTLNTTTNKDFVLNYEMTRNSKKQIQSTKYSYKGADYADGSDNWDYVYNADGSKITFSGYAWTFNSFGNVSLLNYGSSIYAGTISPEYDASNQLTKLRWKEGSYLDVTYTLNAFTTIENPLYNIAKSSQFLNLIYNTTQLPITFSMFIPKSFNNGSIDNIVTYDLDTQKRVNSITVTNNGIVAKKFTFAY